MKPDVLGRRQLEAMNLFDIRYRSPARALTQQELFLVKMNIGMKLQKVALDVEERPTSSQPGSI